MNNLRIYGIIVLLFAACNIYAQSTIHPPANPDESDPVYHELKVVNTGNDMIDYEINNVPYKLRVTVADGQDPHIVSKREDGSGNGLVKTFEIDNSICLNQDIIDPDIVLVNKAGSHHIYALIVYETVTGDVNLVIKRLDNNINWQYSSSISLGQGHHPNIDISRAVDKNLFPGVSDKFVITWENKGDIKSFAGEFQNGLFNYGQISTVFYGSTDTRKPDVTISYIKYNHNLNTPVDHYWINSYTFLN